LSALSRLHARHRDDVAFFAVYVREAHPEDGWVLMENRREGIAVHDPRTAQERTAVARACAVGTPLDLPVLVDGVDDGVARRYGAWPDRIYLIGRDGRVAYQGGPGPFGFSVDELEAAIARELALR
jgi:hypothetical protein